MAVRMHPFSNDPGMSCALDALSSKRRPVDSKGAMLVLPDSASTERTSWLHGPDTEMKIDLFMLPELMRCSFGYYP